MVHFRYGNFTFAKPSMHHFIVKAIATVFQSSLLAGLAACHSFAINDGPRTREASANAAPYQQLIVRFKPATFGCDAAGIARLAEQIGVRLEVVRPMSGNACVIRQMHGSEGFSQGRKKLQQHPSIEWVEPDSVMKPLQ